MSSERLLDTVFGASFGFNHRDQYHAQAKAFPPIYERP